MSKLFFFIGFITLFFSSCVKEVEVVVDESQEDSANDEQEIIVPGVEAFIGEPDITRENIFITGELRYLSSTVMIADYGHCWASHSNPTIDDNFTSFGATSNITDFTSNMGNLLSNTEYYVKVYIKTDATIGYSKTPKVFIITPCIIETGEVTNHAPFRFNVNGRIKVDSTIKIIQYGHIYSTTYSSESELTYTPYILYDIGRTEFGSINNPIITNFSSEIYNYSNNTVYVRAYAIDDKDNIIYGNIIQGHTGK